MGQSVNLDALIPREDFEIQESRNQSPNLQTIQIRDLERTAFFYVQVRKPDFQRETSEWDSAKIVAFIDSFLEADLIPSLILWNSPGSEIFLLDGAHRLSALIAWVQDDYGDGERSIAYFEGQIPEEQRKLARSTRKAIEKAIGNYKEYEYAIKNPDKAKNEIILRRSKRLATLTLQLQWVQGGAEKAESSFFKINQQAAPINKTELRLLKARKYPNAIAARAIIRAGTGHKYWHQFDEFRQNEIEALSKEINKLMFDPELKTPIKTLDLPVGGKSYSAGTLPLIFDFVNLSNSVKTDKDLADDIDGNVTVRYLKKCRQILMRVTGTGPASLGLHPAIYFYSQVGRYQQTAFLGGIKFIMELEATKRFKDFIAVRERMEDVLSNQRVLINQVTNKFGSGVKGYEHIFNLLMALMNTLAIDKDNASVLKQIQSLQQFSFLQPSEIVKERLRKDFDTDSKSAVFIGVALAQAALCKICGGYLHFNAISIDHIERKADGGIATKDNGQLTHPYCNTTIKN